MVFPQPPTLGPGGDVRLHEPVVVVTLVAVNEETAAMLAEAAHPAG